MIIKLSTKLDITKLREYYADVVENFQDLKWSYEEDKEFLNEWNNNDKCRNLTGWGIDSNLVDITAPSLPYNISTREKIDHYRNTKLAFGIINELQTMFPYGYRWSIAVLGPGGYVRRHSDNPKNLTVWIPIYNPEEAKLIMYYNDGESNVHLPSDGSMYFVDTRIDHMTHNNSAEDRVLLSFRFHTEYLNEVLATSI